MATNAALLLTTSLLAVFALLLPPPVSAQSKRVKITTVGSIDAAETSELQWILDAVNEVYCVGDEGITDLAFNCSDCNGTESLFRRAGGMAAYFKANSRPQTRQQNQPVVKLSVTPTSLDIGGKTLQCFGKYDNAGGGAATAFGAFQPAGSADGSQVAVAQARIAINYMEVPRVALDDRSLPVAVGGGNFFYAQCQRERYVDTVIAQGRTVALGQGKCRVIAPLNLQCLVAANPPATAIRWTDGSGAELSRGAQFSLSNAADGGSVQCHAKNKISPFERSSTAVMVKTFEKPTYYSNNFAGDTTSSNNAQQPQRGAPPPSAGRRRIADSVELTCTALGRPAPVVRWMHASADGRTIRNVTCAQRAPDLPSYGATQVHAMVKFNTDWVASTSTCKVTFGNYSAAGSYWCAPCFQTKTAEQRYGQQAAAGATGGAGGVNMLDALGTAGNGNNGAQRPAAAQMGPQRNTEESWVCADGFSTATVPGNQAGVYAVQLEGGPMMFDGRPFIVQPGATQRRAVVAARFCAHPAPDAGRGDVAWRLADGKEVQAGRKVDTYEAALPKPNGTTDDCYIAELTFDPITSADLSSTYEFYVKNQYDPSGRRATFNLAELLDPTAEPVETAEVWWIVLLIVLAVLLLLCLCCCLLYALFRGARCPQYFRGTKSAGQQPPSSSKDKYLSNIAPDQLQPAAGNRYNELTTEALSGNPYASQPPRPGKSPLPLQQRPMDEAPPARPLSREGYNYAELDLAPATKPYHTLPPPRPPPPAHGHQQQPSHQPVLASDYAHLVAPSSRQVVLTDSVV